MPQLVSKLRIDIDSEDYDKLIVIANELDKTTYSLIRDLIKYAIKAHEAESLEIKYYGHSEDGEIKEDGRKKESSID